MKNHAKTTHTKLWCSEHDSYISVSTAMISNQAAHQWSVPLEMVLHLISYCNMRSNTKRWIVRKMYEKVDENEIFVNTKNSNENTDNNKSTAMSIIGKIKIKIRKMIVTIKKVTKMDIWI